jgi:hypothetical protein
MIRKPLLSLLVITVTGALVTALHAQTPKPVKPGNTPTIHAPPPAPPAPAPASPPSQGSTIAPLCKRPAVDGHWDSPRSVVAACLNKQLRISGETQPYQVMAVNDAGFVLKRIFSSSSERETAQEGTRFVPWSAVSYYESRLEYLEVRLVGVQ